MLDFKDVSKIYQNTNVKALENINLKIEKGEFVFLVGHSGAGKSTLIKIITAEEKITDGKVIINNRDISNLAKKDVPYYRRTLGMVFQDFRLLENKTVIDNVAFAMKVVGATKRQIRRKAPDVLGRVGLSNKAKFYPNDLSGGEQQRVAIARALANNPSLIIADEPTGNLDPATSMEIMRYLEEINKSGTTIIVATHDRDIVNTMHKRVVEVNYGTVVRDDQMGGYAEND